MAHIEKVYRKSNRNKLTTTFLMVNVPKKLKLIFISLGIIALVVIAAMIFVFSYTYSVKGIVTDVSTTQPIEGITVAIAGHSSTTDTNGKYDITGIKFYEKNSLKITTPDAYAKHDDVSLSYASLSASKDITVEPTLKTIVAINFKAQENLQYDYMWIYMHPASQAYWGNQKNYTDTMKKIFTYYQSQSQTTNGYKIDGTIRHLNSWDDPITGKTYENIYEVPMSYISVANGQSTPMTELEYYQEANGFFHYFTAMDKNVAQKVVDAINLLKS